MYNYFNTKQISQMIGANEETVRRWLREGTLKGSRDSRKNGFMVLESDLNEFLADRPKYRMRALGTDVNLGYVESPKRKIEKELIEKELDKTAKAIDELKKELEKLHTYKTFYEELLVKLEEIS